MPRVKKSIAEGLVPATIGFRLDPETAAALLSNATSLKISPHELARHYVVKALQGSADSDGVEKSLEQLAAHLIGMRRDLIISVETLLLTAGDLNEEEAHEWVRRNLGK